MLKRSTGSCENGRAAEEDWESARAKLASDPGSSGSSVEEWEIISKNSDGHHETPVDHCAEIERKLCAACHAGTDSQVDEEADYVRFVYDNPAIAPSKGRCNLPCSKWSPWRTMNSCGRPCLRPNDQLHGATDQHVCDFCVHYCPPDREHLLYGDMQEYGEWSSGNVRSVGLECARTAITTAANAPRQFATLAMTTTARYTGSGCRGVGMMRMKSHQMEGTLEKNWKRHLKKPKYGEAQRHPPAKERRRNMCRKAGGPYNCAMRKYECCRTGGSPRRATGAA